MHVKRWEGGRDFAVVRYMDVSPPCDKKDRVLECVSLQRRNDGGIEHALEERCVSSGER